MVRSLIVLSFVLLFISPIYAQEVATQPKIDWLSFEEAIQKQSEQPRPIIIDMYTSWCGWCRKMDASTFANPGIANYINRNFYAVKFDAETRDTIVYNGKTYTNTGTGRRPTHSLAVELCNGRMSYPTIVYMDKQQNKSPVPGYMDPQKIEPLLVFFAEEFNTAISYDDYRKYYDKTFAPDSTKQAYSGEEVTWIPLEKALKMHEKEPKKILLQLDANWIMGSKMMNESYQNPILAKYINEHYYAVKLDVLTRETMDVFGQKFKNEGPDPSIHSLIGALLGQNLKLPATIIFDENAKLINKLQVFMSPPMLEILLHFFGEDAYTSVKWDDYRSTFKNQISE